MKANWEQGRDAALAASAPALQRVPARPVAQTPVAPKRSEGGWTPGASIPHSAFRTPHFGHGGVPAKCAIRQFPPHLDQLYAIYYRGVDQRKKPQKKFRMQLTTNNGLLTSGGIPLGPDAKCVTSVFSISKTDQTILFFSSK